jgi:hypothetical protein
MILVLSRGVSVQKIGGRQRVWSNSIAKWKSVTAAWSPSARKTWRRPTSTVPAVGAHWPFLSDAGRKVQKHLDIAEYTDATHDPMIPHTIVLEPGLIVFKIYVGYWFFGRPKVEELR